MNFLSDYYFFLLLFSVSAFPSSRRFQCLHLEWTVTIVVTGPIVSLLQSFQLNLCEFFCFEHNGKMCFPIEQNQPKIQNRKEIKKKKKHLKMHREKPTQKSLKGIHICIDQWQNAKIIWFFVEWLRLLATVIRCIYLWQQMPLSCLLHVCSLF